MVNEYAEGWYAGLGGYSYLLARLARFSTSLRVGMFCGVRGWLRSLTASPNRSLRLCGIPPIDGFSSSSMRIDTQMPRQELWKMCCGRTGRRAPSGGGRWSGGYSPSKTRTLLRTGARSEEGDQLSLASLATLAGRGSLPTF